MTDYELVQSALEMPKTTAGLSISPETEDEEELVNSTTIL
jgi:hypothetical protein